MSSILRILVVCHCYREDDETIRIISARKVTKNEQKEYERRKYMRDKYDFSSAIKNPYIRKNKTNITIRLDENVLDYFKELSQKLNIPYQTLINSFLTDCAKNKKELAWQK